MQETYALHDLKEFNCDEEISILLDSFTPQEVLRTIRHSTKGKVRMEEIQKPLSMQESLLYRGSSASLLP